MNAVSFRTEPLGNRARDQFCYGVEALDRYFHRQVSQDVRRRLTACYVALCSDSESICGFYTLSACHIALPDLPAETTRKLPPYPAIPAVRVGRLAVDQECRGQGLGSAMLVDAARRVIESDIAAFALVVDAKDDKARQPPHGRDEPGEQLTRQPVADPARRVARGGDAGNLGGAEPDAVAVMVPMQLRWWWRAPDLAAAIVGVRRRSWSCA